MEQKSAPLINGNEDRDEIEKLIAAEDDPKVRLQLIVMHRINLSLIANTQTINDVARTTNDVALRLEDHILAYAEHTKKETALVNKGKGAWKVLVWVAACIQALGAAIWVEVRGDIHDYQVAANIDRAATETQKLAIDRRLVTVETIQADQTAIINRLLK